MLKVLGGGILALFVVYLCFQRSSPIGSTDIDAQGEKVPVGPALRLEIGTSKGVLTLPIGDEEIRSVAVGEQDSLDRQSLPDSLEIQGTVYSVTWKDGLRTVRFPGGALFSQGHFVDGEREGEFRVWHENGELRAVSQYSNGRRDGLCRHFNDIGILISEGVYVDGWREGVWVSWWDNGAEESVGEYRHGKEHGFWQFRLWDGSDAETSTGFYEDGKRLLD